MPQDTPTLYNTYIDYEHDVDWDINKIADYQAMQQIAGDDFSIASCPLCLTGLSIDT